MNLSHLQNKLDVLYEFAVQYYPKSDNRPEKLRMFGDAAFNSTDNRELHERLRYLQSFISGGMNRFIDINLQAPENCELTAVELNQKLRTLNNDLYMLLDEILKA